MVSKEVNRRLLQLWVRLLAVRRKCIERGMNSQDLEKLPEYEGLFTSIRAIESSAKERDSTDEKIGKKLDKLLSSIEKFEKDYNLVSPKVELLRAHGDLDTRIELLEKHVPKDLKKSYERLKKQHANLDRMLNDVKADDIQGRQDLQYLIDTLNAELREFEKGMEHYMPKPEDEEVDQERDSGPTKKGKKKAQAANDSGSDSDSDSGLTKKQRKAKLAKELASEEKKFEQQKKQQDEQMKKLIDVKEKEKAKKIEKLQQEAEAKEVKKEEKKNAVVAESSAMGAAPNIDIKDPKPKDLNKDPAVLKHLGFGGYTPVGADVKDTFVRAGAPLAVPDKGKDYTTTTATASPSRHGTVLPARTVVNDSQAVVNDYRDLKLMLLSYSENVQSQGKEYTKIRTYGNTTITEQNVTALATFMRDNIGKVKDPAKRKEIDAKLSQIEERYRPKPVAKAHKI